MSLRPGRPDVRDTLRLALPIAAVQVGVMLMGVVDTAMVGRVSAADLGAVALGNVYFFATTSFGMGVLMALDPVISQALGAGDPRGVRLGLHRGGILALGLTLVASLLMLPAGPVLEWAGQPGDVVPIAARYVRATLPGVLPFFLFLVLRQTLQAMGRLRPILIAILLANGLNAFLNWVLIFGRGGLPQLGAVGSGWASSISRWAMAILLLAAAWPVLRPVLLPVPRGVLAWRPLARMLSLGVPIGFQVLAEFGAFGVAGILMGWIGTVPMAAHQIALNLASLTFMVPLGISQATSVLVGRRIGAGDPDGARRSAGAGLLAGVGFMTGCALAFLLVPGWFAALYSRDAEVLFLAGLLIPIAGIFQVADGIQVVSSGILRGVGDTRIPAFLNLLGFWGIGMPVALLLAFRTPLGPRGLWWGLALGLGSVAILLLLRVRRRMARDLERIRVDEERGGGVHG